jgi:adenine C2-methylase RlmN of 23S rRNA A2503 and tRNA A37
MFSGQWLLLLVYTVSTSGFFMTLKTFFCTQCMNFACPLNAVDAETRDRFFKQNPVVLNAWKDNTSD